MNVIEPEPIGRLVIPEPSPTKNPALTVPENSPEVAESLVKSTALTVILSNVASPLTTRSLPIETLLEKPPVLPTKVPPSKAALLIVATETLTAGLILTICPPAFTSISFGPL